MLIRLPRKWMAYIQRGRAWLALAGSEAGSDVSAATNWCFFRPREGQIVSRETMRKVFMLVVVAWLSNLAVAAEHEGEHENAHGHPKNVIAGFVGVTHEGRRENAATFGLEYERRLDNRFGVGVIAERAIGELDFWVFAIPFAFHSGPWKVYVAPGIEDGDLGSEDLFRVGVEYGFEVGTWEIAPQLDVDFVDGEEVFVFGVTFGKGF